MENNRSLEDKELNRVNGGAMFRPQVQYLIQEDICVGCCVCVEVCPAGAIREIRYAPVMDYTRCIDCHECASKCPMGAIERMVRFLP